MRRLLYFVATDFNPLYVCQGNTRVPQARSILIFQILLSLGSCLSICFFERAKVRCAKIDQSSDPPVIVIIFAVVAVVFSIVDIHCIFNVAYFNCRTK